MLKHCSEFGICVVQVDWPMVAVNADHLASLSLQEWGPLGAILTPL
jgi:hypothetical protein